MTVSCRLNRNLLFHSFGLQVTDVVIAEQSDFVASFSALEQTLKVWSVAEKGREIFQIKLKVRGGTDALLCRQSIPGGTGEKTVRTKEGFTLYGETCLL